jgi:hypothetical protein
MEKLIDNNQNTVLKENSAINVPVISNSEIIFNGSGNILYSTSDACLIKDSKIIFNGNNS